VKILVYLGMKRCVILKTYKQCTQKNRFSANNNKWSSGRYEIHPLLCYGYTTSY